MAATTKHLVLKFEIERDTKNKQRFEERDVDPKVGPVVDKLYISKKAWDKLGKPKALHVTIEAP